MACVSRLRDRPPLPNRARAPPHDELEHPLVAEHARQLRPGHQASRARREQTGTRSRPRVTLSQATADQGARRAQEHSKLHSESTLLWHAQARRAGEPTRRDVARERVQNRAWHARQLAARPFWRTVPRGRTHALCCRGVGARAWNGERRPYSVSSRVALVAFLRREGHKTGFTAEEQDGKEGMATVGEGCESES
eukprot:2478704-Pleurochrysis_carterae.AAC.3